MGEGLGPLLIRSLTGTGILRLIGMAASFAVGVQLARVLGVNGYGYYGIALAVVTVASIPGELGLPRLVTREVAAAKARDDLGALFGIIRWADRIAVRISVSVAALITAGSLAVSHGKWTTLTLAIICGAPLVPLVALTRIRGGALLALDQIASGQTPDIVFRPLIFSLLIFIAVQATGGLGAPVAMLLSSAAALCSFVIGHAWLRSKLRRLAPTPAIEHGRQWLASTIPMGLAEGMRVLQSELSSLLLGVIAGPAQVGLFRIANATAVTAATPTAVVQQVAFPVIARLHAKEDTVRLQKAVTGLSRAQFLGVLLLCLPLLVWTKLLLTLVFGPGYSAAAGALRIFAAAQIISAAFGPGPVLLNMTKYEKRVTRATFVVLPLNVLGVVTGGWVWGVIGAATALGLSLVSWVALCWFDARRLLGIDASVAGFAAIKAEVARTVQS